VAHSKTREVADQNIPSFLGEIIREAEKAWLDRGASWKRSRPFKGVQSLVLISKTTLPGYLDESDQHEGSRHDSLRPPKPAQVSLGRISDFLRSTTRTAKRPNIM